MIIEGKRKALIDQNAKHIYNVLNLINIPFSGVHLAIEKQRHKTVMMEIMRLDPKMFRRSGKVDQRKLRRLNRKHNKNQSFMVSITDEPSEFVMNHKEIEINLMSDT